MNKAILAIIVAVTIWGINFSVTKVGLTEIEPITLAFFRFFISSILLITIIFFTKQAKALLKALKKDFRYFFVMGLFGITMIYVLENLALKLSTSSEVALIICADPILIILFASFFLGEKLNIKKIISITLGIIGVILIIIKHLDLSTLFDSSAFIGNILALLSSVAWATYTLMTKKKVEKYSPEIVLAIVSIFGVLFLSISMLIFEGVPQISELSTRSWLVVAYVSVVVSTIAFYCWNYGLKHLQASKAGMYMFLMPVIAVFVGIIFLKEELTLRTGIGATAILIGIYLAEKSEKKIVLKKHPQPKSVG